MFEIEQAILQRAKTTYSLYTLVHRRYKDLTDEFGEVAFPEWISHVTLSGLFDRGVNVRFYYFTEDFCTTDVDVDLNKAVFNNLTKEQKEYLAFFMKEMNYSHYDKPMKHEDENAMFFTISYPNQTQQYIWKIPKEVKLPVFAKLVTEMKRSEKKYVTNFDIALLQSVGDTNGISNFVYWANQFFIPSLPSLPSCELFHCVLINTAI